MQQQLLLVREEIRESSDMGRPNPRNKDLERVVTVRQVKRRAGMAFTGASNLTHDRSVAEHQIAKFEDEISTHRLESSTKCRHGARGTTTVPGLDDVLYEFDQPKGISDGHTKIPLNSRKLSYSLVNSHTMTTRRKSAQAACRAVLETAELLENIIVHLEQEDIVRVAAQVNHAWLELISVSPSIRKKVFRFHQPEETLEDLEGDWAFDIETQVWAPVKNMEGYLPRVRDTPEWYKRQRAVRPVVLNPLVFQVDPSLPRPSITRRAIRCEDVHFRAPPNLAKLAMPLRQPGDYISCQLVCQPPVKSVEFYVMYQDTQHASLEQGDDNRPLTFIFRERIKIENNHGVRIHDIAQGLLQVAGRKAGKNQISITLSRGRDKSRLWMPGAVFVSETEKAQLEKEAREFCNRLRSS